MYVGQTGNAIKERFKSHFYHITSGKYNNLLVPGHFNQDDHQGIDDIEIYVLGLIHEEAKSKKAWKNRRHLEGIWQHRLNTIRPNGLNTLDEA